MRLRQPLLLGLALAASAAGMAWAWRRARPRPRRAEGARPAPEPERPLNPGATADEASEDSFPASDAPASMVSLRLGAPPRAAAS